MEAFNQQLPLVLSIFPVVLLIWLMVKKNSVPSYIALPGVAFFIYLLQIFYFKNDFMMLNANAAAGVVATLTPITVIFGAIFFNRMMEATGCINVIRQWLGNINPNPVAQLMIIGWAFAFMIEGASGFGTPAAIAAPILVGLGFKPMQVAVFALIMNSVPVSFGAVGTPTWFGFGELKKSGILSDADILAIGKETGLIHFVAGFIIPVLALRFITTWAEIRKNIGFIYLSILACTIPYLLLAQVNYEFPSLVGGGIGLLLSVFLANKGVGLAKTEMLHIFKNGEIVFTRALTGWGRIVYNNMGDLVLGTYAFQTDPPQSSTKAQVWAQSFPGKLDNFAFYNQALTDEQIKALYNE